MTWNRYGRGNGWEKFAEAMATMAMSGAMNGNTSFGGPNWKMRARFDEDFPGGREADGEGDERGPGRRGRRGRMFGQGELRLALLAAFPALSLTLVRWLG